MRILVTGGAGYIGSHTAKALFQAGHEPVVFDNLSVGHGYNVRWGPLIQGDLRNSELLRTTFKAQKIDAVIHLAGSAYVGESIVEPYKYFDNNFSNTLLLLEAMLQENIKIIVFSSSCSIYGRPEILPVAECQEGDPLSPYGESKLFVERVLRAFGFAHGFKWFALRYFNAAGADPDGETGEDHNPETHIIPLAIRAALSLSEYLDVFGNDYPTPDGTAIRDYTHVTDLATAHVAALEYICGGAEGMALNLGTGKGISIREVISMVERVTGRTVPDRFRRRRAGDAPTLVADNRLSMKVLGCRYPYSELTTIVETASQWQLRRLLKADQEICNIGGPVQRWAESVNGIQGSRD